jgi:hypothetical protein
MGRCRGATCLTQPVLGESSTIVPGLVETFMKGNRAMANATVRRATSQPGAETVRRAVSSIGLLQVVIILLALATAFVHLDKAWMLGVFGGHPAMPSGGMPSGSHAGAPSATGGHRAGAPRGGMLPLPLPLSVLFLLNFVGYLVLIVALYVPLPRLARYQQRYHRLIRWLLIAFAAITILGYFAIVGTMPNPLGELDKALEIGLIVFLLLEDRYTQVATQLART